MHIFKNYYNYCFVCNIFVCCVTPMLYDFVFYLSCSFSRIQYILIQLRAFSVEKGKYIF